MQYRVSLLLIHTVEHLSTSLDGGVFRLLVNLYARFGAFYFSTRRSTRLKVFGSQLLDRSTCTFKAKLSCSEKFPARPGRAVRRAIQLRAPQLVTSFFLFQLGMLGRGGIGHSSSACTSLSL